MGLARSYCIQYDEERLLVNVSAMHRVQKVAGLACISITAYTGETSEYDVQISSINASGAATASGRQKRTARPLSKGNLTFPYSTSQVGSPMVHIQINSSESDARLSRDDRYTKRELDPHGRAVILNQALRRGLLEASRDANIDYEKAKVTLRYYGVFIGLGFLLGSSNPWGIIPGVTAIGPVIRNLSYVRDLTLTTQKDDSIKDRWRELRQSAFVGIAIDRYAAATAILASSKLITARK